MKPNLGNLIFEHSETRTLALFYYNNFQVSQDEPKKNQLNLDRSKKNEWLRYFFG